MQRVIVPKEVAKTLDRAFELGYTKYDLVNLEIISKNNPEIYDVLQSYFINNEENYLRAILQGHKEDYKENYKTGLEVDLNYDTVELAKVQPDPIYVYKGEDGDLVLNIEEAIWLKEKLNKFIDLLK
ncbi:hypothetical protein [Priestia megaterium]|uniref:hypothetical protein n=1 Tax=Priestia megaterium TaxID=1404 RepID=UPI002877B15C|nr:hypothetical protein [Priestia megaterium]